MDGAQLTATLTAVLGGSGLLALIAKGVFDQMTGRAGHERTRNADLKTQRDDAWAERDAQEERATREQKRADRFARNTNRWADLAARYRRRLIDLGAEPNDLPSEPLNLEKE